mgnify:CR=1 FL=1
MKLRRSKHENLKNRENREDTELTRASLRLAVQFTALVVVLLGLAGGLVYGLVSSQTREAVENTLSSATQFDSPRDVPLDVFLAVYDDGRLAVSRNMPSGLPDQEALAEVAETGVARRDTVTAGDRTYEVLTDRRGRDVVQAAVDAGSAGVYLAGTSGEEEPGEMYDGVAEVRSLYPDLEVGVHLHNRNGFAPANALAAMLAGADWLEGSFAGLGGDLWFPGDPSVLGNAPLEDLVHLCDGLGISTGIDLPAYMRAVDRSVELTGRPSASFVSRGGTRADLAAASWPELPEPAAGRG